MPRSLVHEGLDEVQVHLGVVHGPMGAQEEKADALLLH